MLNGQTWVAWRCVFLFPKFPSSRSMNCFLLISLGSSRRFSRRKVHQRPADLQRWMDGKKKSKLSVQMCHKETRNKHIRPKMRIGRWDLQIISDTQQEWTIDKSCSCWFKKLRISTIRLLYLFLLQQNTGSSPVNNRVNRCWVTSYFEPLYSWKSRGLDDLEDTNMHWKQLKAI